MRYNSWADVCHRNGWVVRCDVYRKVRRVSIPAWSSCVSSLTEELGYNETVCLWMTIYNYIFYFPRVFHTSVYWWAFTGVSKSSQISRILLCIQADFTNAVVWLVLILPMISNLSTSFSGFLRTIWNALTTIGITFTFMFHNFFSSLARSKCLFLSFSFLLFSLCGLLEQ